MDSKVIKVFENRRTISGEPFVYRLPKPKIVRHIEDKFGLQFAPETTGKWTAGGTASITVFEEHYRDNNALFEDPENGHKYLSSFFLVFEGTDVNDVKGDSVSNHIRHWKGLVEFYSQENSPLHMDGEGGLVVVLNGKKPRKLASIDFDNHYVLRSRDAQESKLYEFDPELAMQLRWNRYVRLSETLFPGIPILEDRLKEVKLGE